MRAILFGLATAALAAASISPASADCTCRAPGFVAHHGETVCLNTPQGPRLARCEMVLNNSSWKFLQDGCPEASRAPTSLFAAMSVAPADAPVLR